MATDMNVLEIYDMRDGCNSALNRASFHRDKTGSQERPDQPLEGLMPKAGPLEISRLF